MDEIIDLLSDTVTRPLPEMRDAIAAAGLYALDQDLEKLTDDHTKAPLGAEKTVPSE